MDDLIEGLVRLMDTAADFTGPVNLGNPAEITIRELAEKIVALTASRSAVDFRALPQDDPSRRCPDITLARKALGWEPSMPLEGGLRRTIDYFATLLGETGRG